MTTLKERYPFCQLCGSTDSLHEHHIIHKSLSGTDDKANLVVLCAECHQRHHDARLTITCENNTITFADPETGEIIKTTTLIPYDAPEDSTIVAEANAIERWLDPDAVVNSLKDKSTEELLGLYHSLVTIRQLAWTAQCAIIAELKGRASYGDKAVETVASQLGISRTTAYYRANEAELLSDPECAPLTTVLPQESWWAVASDTPEPKRWLQHAAERKADNPGYSIRQFKAEIAENAGENEVSTMQAIVIIHNGELTLTDQRLARNIDRSYGVPVYTYSSIPSEALQLSAGRPLL